MVSTSGYFILHHYSLLSRRSFHQEAHSSSSSASLLHKVLHLPLLNSVSGESRTSFFLQLNYVLHAQSQLFISSVCRLHSTIPSILTPPHLLDLLVPSATAHNLFGFLEFYSCACINMKMILCTSKSEFSTK